MTTDKQAPSRPAPPYDSELAVALATWPEPPVSITPELIPMRRAQPRIPPEEIIGDRPVVYTDRTIPGPDGAPDLVATILQRPDRKPGGPAVYYIHGGGMIFPDRWSGIPKALDWITDLDAVMVSVEYRVAPEHPYPAPLDDCYAGLLWTAAQAAEFGYDPAQLVIGGASAGGGLTAGVTLRARDEHGPALAAQVLIYPMLDDRNETASSYQFDGFGPWDRTSNDTGWDAYLGDRRRTANVPVYAAPGRATDLSGLPPTFIDVGSAEVFRDEDVAYASQIWADGGVCELHVWPGGYHGFDLSAPDTALARAMTETRNAWLRRTLSVPPASPSPR
jgi:acetyl esterase/lipase